MTLEKLFEQANEAKKVGGNMTLVLPVRFKRPKGFPDGTFLSEEKKGNIYSFDPDEIINFVQKCEALNV